MNLNLDIIKSALDNVGLCDCDINSWENNSVFKVTRKGIKPITLDATAVPTLSVDLIMDVVKNVGNIEFGESKWYADGVLIYFNNGNVEINGTGDTVTINLSDPNSINSIGLAIKQSLETAEKYFKSWSEVKREDRKQ